MARKKAKRMARVVQSLKDAGWTDQHIINTLIRIIDDDDVLDTVRVILEWNRPTSQQMKDSP